MNKQFLLLCISGVSFDAIFTALEKSKKAKVAEHYCIAATFTEQLVKDIDNLLSGKEIERDYFDKPNN